MKRQRASVAMATYDGERFVEEQIRSVLAQDLSDLELVISDDGSSDATPQICRRMAQEDDRIRVLDPAPERLGVARNFERALRHTRGEVVALADQDDVWDTDKLSTLAKRLAEGYDLAVSDLRVIGEDGAALHSSFTRFQRLRVQEGHPLREVLIRNFVTGCAALFTRRLLETALPFPPDCGYHDWWLAVVAAARGGIGYVARPLAGYRQHAANVVGATGSGLGRVRHVLRSVADAADPGLYDPELRRVRGYCARPDVFDTDARRADLAFAVQYFEDQVGRDALPFGRRLGLLRRRLRYQSAGGVVNAGVATLGTLFPGLSRRAVRRMQAEDAQ